MKDTSGLIMGTIIVIVVLLVVAMGVNGGN